MKKRKKKKKKKKKMKKIIKRRKSNTKFIMKQFQNKARQKIKKLRKRIMTCRDYTCSTSVCTSKCMCLSCVTSVVTSRSGIGIIKKKKKATHQRISDRKRLAAGANARNPESKCKTEITTTKSSARLARYYVQIFEPMTEENCKMS